MAGRLNGWLVVVIGSALVVAGCGRSLLVDADRMEADIASHLVPGAADAVTDVACPDVILPGTELDCTARIGGVQIDVSVVLSEQAQADISTTAVLVDVAEMERSAAERLSADIGVDTTVTCPGPAVVVSREGATLECDAVDPTGVRHRVVITIRSGQGDWDLSIG